LETPSAGELCPLEPERQDDGVLPGGADPHDEVTARILSDQGADPGLKRAIADLNRKQAGQLAEARQDGGQ